MPEETTQVVTETSTWDAVISAATTVSVIIALLGAVAWLVTPRITAWARGVAADARTTRQQVAENNEGSHARDMWNRMEASLRRLEDRSWRNTERIDTLSTKLDRKVRDDEADRVRYLEALRHQGIDLDNPEE